MKNNPLAVPGLRAFRAKPARGAFVALALFALPHWAMAQTVRLPSEADITRLRPPSLPLPSVPNFDLRIETPERSPVPRAVDDLVFAVKGVVVEGASHYPQAQVDQVFAGLVGQSVGLEAIRKAADALEQRYRADGFFLVRVFVPPQQVKDGLLRVQVIEGFIGSVAAEGGTPQMREKVERLMASLTKQRPIDLASLERALLTLNDIPGLAGGGVLRPGGALGASDLIVALVDPGPAVISLAVNNASSKTLGTVGLSANANFTNPFQEPGVFSLGFNSSADAEKLRALNARYAWGIAGTGIVASVGALEARARPAGSIRDVLGLDVFSLSHSVTPRLRYALTRGRESSVYLESGLALNRSRITGVPSPDCTDGSPATRDRSSVLDVSGSWVGSAANSQTSLTVGAAQGLDILGAWRRSDYDFRCKNPSEAGFEPEFLKFTASLQHTQSLAAQWSLQLSLQGQTTGDTLASGEQVSFGGGGIGRGYDGGAIAGDTGWGGLIELRYAVLPDTLAGQAWMGENPRLQLFVFADYAEATKRAVAASRLVNATEDDPAERFSLASYGLGFRWNNSLGWSVEGLLAKAQKDLDASDPRSDPRFLLSVTKIF